MEEEKRSMATKLEDLPIECIVEIVLHATTTPVDASILCFVSKAFRKASEYDVVWDRFIPSDSTSIISLYSSSSFSSTFNSKKSLYLTLSDSDHPTIIDHGEKSFHLDKRTGNKCFMFSGRDHTISWMIHPHFEWRRLPESRFEQVAMFHPGLFMFTNYRVIDSSILSPDTHYEAFLVFKFIKGRSTTLEGYRGVPRVPRPRKRRDGWLEIAIGTLESSPKEDQVPNERMSKVISGICTLGGFFFEGIEVRPHSPQRND